MNQERLSFLLDRHADLACTPEEIQELEAYLLESAQARKQFWEHARLIALLREASHADLGIGMARLDTAGYAEPNGMENRPAGTGSIPAIELPAVDAAERSSGVLSASLGSTRPVRARWDRGLPYASAMSFLLGIVVASIVLVIVLGGVKLDDPQPSSLHHAQVPVAYLTTANGCNWGDALLTRSVVGSPVKSGDALTLQEGIAEFQLASGVHLSIEGPAGLVLISPNSLILQYGRLTTHVPDSVTDFKVLAGACRLSGRATEFGVYLAGGNVDVHVFSGQVLATNASFMESRGGIEDAFTINGLVEDGVIDQIGILHETTVPGGRSLSLADGGETVHITSWGVSDDTKFATRLPVAESLPVGKAYVDAIRASSPVGYWRFESIDGGVVNNEISDRLDLQTVGNLRLVGDATNRAVELGQSDSDGYLATVDPTDDFSRSDYSVEVWLRPSHVHIGVAVTLAGDSPKTHDERPAFYLELQGSANHASSFSDMYPGTIRFLNRDPPGRMRQSGTSCFSDKLYLSRCWQHVVAVKEGAKMRLYVNGALAASADEDNALALGLRVIVGQATRSSKQSRFVGQLDELSMYNRALTEAEIQQHFEAVHGPPHPLEPMTRTSFKTLWEKETAPFFSRTRKIETALAGI